jgi:hypothetical protein
VGLLRGYGNAISPWAAKTFIEAFEEARCDEVTDAWPDLLSLMEAAE